MIFYVYKEQYKGMSLMMMIRLRGQTHHDLRKHQQREIEMLYGDSYFAMTIYIP